MVRVEPFDRFRKRFKRAASSRTHTRDPEIIRLQTLF